MSHQDLELHRSDQPATLGKWLDSRWADLKRDLRFNNAVELITATVSSGLTKNGLNATRFVGGRMVQSAGCPLGTLPRFGPLICKMNVLDSDYKPAASDV
mmetsp:Transcript_17737/g.46394  ORF Transcript_17737/g.46394 Transcript_17737/m.46394 type:complete len:100 (+) Transcript_17737:591-890(+)